MNEKKFNAASKELAKQLIEQAEFNCTGQNINYTIEDIKPLSEDGAYLVLHLRDFAELLLYVTKMVQPSSLEIGKAITQKAKKKLKIMIGSQ